MPAIYQEMKELKVYYGDDILKVLNKLKELHDKGEDDWFADVGEFTFYSADIDVEENFKEYTGMSIEEFNKKLKETEETRKFRHELEYQQAQHFKNKRIQEGYKRISIYKHEAWKDYIDQMSIKKLAMNHIMNTVVKYLKYLHDEEYSVLTTKEVAQMFMDEFGNEVGDWYTTAIVTKIAEFSDRGPDFDSEVYKLLKEKSNRKIMNHKPYVANLKEINKLNDLNVQYEDAKELADKEMYELLIKDVIHAEVIKVSETDYIGIDIDSNDIVLARSIDEKFVIHKINSNRTCEIYVDREVHDVHITNSKLNMYYYQNPLQLIPIRKNTKLKAKIFKDFNSTVDSSKETFLRVVNSRRIFNQLEQPVNDEIKVKTIDTVMELKRTSE